MFNILIKYTDDPSGLLSFQGKNDEFETKEAAIIAGQKIIKGNKGVIAYVVWPDHKERIFLRKKNKIILKKHFVISKRFVSLS